MHKNKKSTFNLKPPLTFDEQLHLLESRNIIVTDKNKALEFLKNNSYYRLTGYALQFREENGSYKENTKLSTIVNVYEFDKGLRRALSILLEDFEISFKTCLSYHLSHKYGPECYLKDGIFRKKEWYLEFRSAISKNIKKSSNEVFIRHHINKYKRHFPFWVLIEVIPFSSFSKFFNSLRNAEKNDFSRKYYNCYGGILANWAHHFSVVRNICAHYGRLYNKNLFPILTFLKEDGENLKTGKIFDTFFILKKFFHNKPVWSKTVKTIEKLVTQYRDDIEIKLIGFPNNWKNLIQ